MNAQYITNSFMTMFILVLVVCVIIVVFRRLKNRSAPKVVTNATVSDKHIQEIMRRRKGADGLYHQMKTYRYYILFIIEGGEKMEFLVNKTEYSQVKNNQNGKLTFQGSKFIKFDK